MPEQAPPVVDRSSRRRAEPALDISPDRRRRRVYLRHSAGVVAAELRRMRRVNRSDPFAARP